jgi:hypothetical protein
VRLAEHVQLVAARLGGGLPGRVQKGGAVTMARASESASCFASSAGV